MFLHISLVYSVLIRVHMHDQMESINFVLCIALISVISHKIKNVFKNLCSDDLNTHKYSRPSANVLLLKGSHEMSIETLVVFERKFMRTKQELHRDLLSLLLHSTALLFCVTFILLTDSQVLHKL